MNNNVVLALGSALADQSIVAFMFNFRGVGRSQGQFEGGIGEQEDVIAAVDWLTTQSEVDRHRLGIAGYSFGAIVALPAACDDERVKALTLISPPLEPSQISQLKDCAKLKLIICGTEDFLVSLQQAELINRESAEPKQFELIAGADHFWWGYEVAMAQKVTVFFNTSFNRL